MTSWGDYEPELRNWLVDYLVTNIGCSPDQIDLDAPLNELGVGSRDAVVLSGELSELLRRPVSPVDFWQNPTINALATRWSIPVRSQQSAHCPAPRAARRTSRSPSSGWAAGCRATSTDPTRCGTSSPRAAQRFRRCRRAVAGVR
jgi:acyl carrier protein